MKNILLNALVGLLAVLMLAGCETTVEEKKTTGTLSSMTGKPGAPVSLTYSVPSAKKLGQAIEIDLSFVFDSAVDSATISFGPSEGLELVNARSLAVTDQQRGDSHAISLKVVPRESGLRFVSIFAVTKQGQKEMRRSFAVPVTAGGSAAPKKAMPDPLETPEGEKVISMPAEETDGT